MLAPEALPDRHEALEGLRTTLRTRHRATSDAAFVATDHLIPTGFPELDRALAGGFPRGAIATLEGPASSGRCTVAARLLAAATAHGLGALIQGGETGTLYPPALQVAGVALDRLLVATASEAIGVARAADILLRSKAFGVVVIPAAPLSAAAWTRLAGIAHRANALLVAVGTKAPHDLRYFASLRLRLQLSRVRWAGDRDLFATLAGYDILADVIKAKRSAPGRSALVPCTTFEISGARCAAVRERAFAGRARAFAGSDSRSDVQIRLANGR
jgi:recombination protein RecA